LVEDGFAIIAVGDISAKRKGEHMGIEVLKNVFFFIGSVLGIIAFIKTLIEPMVESNRAKWKETKERITEEDFINLEFDIYQARRIRDETWSVIRGFVNDIEEGAEYLRFNSILKKLYNQSLNNLRTLYWELIEFIQVPYWEPHRDVDEDGNEFRYWRFNRQYFFKTHNDPDAYVDHLDAAAEIAEKMRMEFRKLSILSNLHAVQIPFAKRIIAKGAKIPKRIAASTEPTD